MNGEVWREFITPDIIVQLHGEGIARYGGPTSPPRDGCIGTKHWRRIHCGTVYGKKRSARSY